jgi:hypothetical protein
LTAESMMHPGVKEQLMYVFPQLNLSFAVYLLFPSVFLATIIPNQLKRNTFINPRARSENPRYRRPSRAVLSFETKEFGLSLFLHMYKSVSSVVPSSSGLGEQRSFYLVLLVDRGPTTSRDRSTFFRSNAVTLDWLKARKQTSFFFLLTYLNGGVLVCRLVFGLLLLTKGYYTNTLLVPGPYMLAKFPMKSKPWPFTKPFLLPLFPHPPTPVSQHSQHPKL